LTWNGKPSEYTFTQTPGTSEWKSTFVDANNVTQTFFTVTMKPDGNYDFQLNTALPTLEKSSGSLFSGITGGSNLSSFTFGVEKFSGAFSLVLTASDNKVGEDTLTISATELGINGNSIQEQFGETLKIDVIQQPGFTTASLTSLTIGLATTAGLKAGDAFLITVHSEAGVSTPQSMIYDGSGFLNVQIPTSLGVVDYVTLTPTTSNMNFKITGMSVEYTQPIDPSDMNLQFTATGVDNDGDTISDSFNVNLISGTSGDDTLLTGETNDTVSGGAGNDIINTGDGNDTLIGGAGNDTLTGGAGADTFKWSLGDEGTPGTVDHITDFYLAPVASGGDALDLGDLLIGEHANAESLVSYLNFSEGTGSDAGKAVITIIDVDGAGPGTSGQAIILDNVSYAELQVYAGNSSANADIITALLDNGNLKTDI
jgi:hypothetical protein